MNNSTRVNCFNHSLGLLEGPSRMVLVIALFHTASMQLYAQSSSPSGPQVVGHGTAKLEMPAESMQVSLSLLVIANDIPSAVKEFKKKAEQVRTKLAEMGAKKDSIRFGRMTIDENASKAFNSLLAETQDLAASVDTEIPAAEALKNTNSKVATRMDVLAEWQMDADDPNQILAEAHKKLELLDATDFNTDVGKGLKPEEQELLEEANIFARRDEYGDEIESDDKHTVVYTAKISAEQRASLMRKAFENAKLEAQELAVAAGTSLGKMTTVKKGDHASESVESNYSNYALMQQQAEQAVKIQKLQQWFSDDQMKLMAVGTDVSRLIYQVDIEAGFSIQNGGEKN